MDRCGAQEFSKPKFTLSQSQAGCSGTHAATPGTMTSVGRERIHLPPVSRDQWPAESDLHSLQVFRCEKIRNFGLKEWVLPTETTDCKVSRLRKSCDNCQDLMALQRPSKVGTCLCTKRRMWGFGCNKLDTPKFVGTILKKLLHFISSKLCAYFSSVSHHQSRLLETFLGVFSFSCIPILCRGKITHES